MTKREETLKERITRLETFPIPPIGDLSETISSGYQSLKDQMEEDGVLTDETTFKEMCQYAGEHIRIVDVDDEELL